MMLMWEKLSCRGYCARGVPRSRSLSSGHTKAEEYLPIEGERGRQTSARPNSSLIRRTLLMSVARSYTTLAAA